MIERASYPNTKSFESNFAARQRATASVQPVNLNGHAPLTKPIEAPKQIQTEDKNQTLRDNFLKHADNTKVFMSKFQHLSDIQNPKKQEANMLFDGLLQNLSEINNNIKITLMQMQSLIQKQSAAQNPRQLSQLNDHIKSHRQFLIDQSNYLAKMRELYHQSSKFLKDNHLTPEYNAIAKQQKEIKQNLASLDRLIRHAEIEQKIKFRQDPTFVQTPTPNKK